MSWYRISLRPSVLGAVALACLTALQANAQSPAGEGYTRIVAGNLFSCALDADAEVWCWGSNELGQLGDGTGADRLTPARVPGLGPGVTHLAAGGHHACAIDSLRQLWCWGRNDYGQLGDGSVRDQLSPVRVAGLNHGATDVSASRHHTCALDTADRAWCWGWNGRGQLGDNTTIQRLTPVQVRRSHLGMTAITVGDFHTCALDRRQRAWCWGWNLDGALGDGSVREWLTPVQVQGLNPGLTGLSAGGAHTCALDRLGRVSCWGLNRSGQLGDGTRTRRLTPVRVPGLYQGMSGLTAGESHSCVLDRLGRARCWGYNGFGQIGVGTVNDALTQTRVNRLNQGLTGLEAGDRHSCALDRRGRAWCWGYNSAGQLGHGTASFRRLSPRRVILP